MFNNDLNFFHFVRSISAAILKAGIVLPIDVIAARVDIKDIELKGEGGLVL
jgi:hypothetical protein